MEFNNFIQGIDEDSRPSQMKYLTKWQQILKEMISSCSKADGKILMQCILKYVGYVINYATLIDSCRKQILICKSSFATIKEIIKSDFKIIFIEEITKSVFDIIIEESFATCIKKELLKVFNDCVHSVATKVRHNVGERLPIYLLKMVDNLGAYGDYDFQVILIEAIFLMFSKNAMISCNLIPESRELCQTFTEINNDTFDVDVRSFLNILNTKPGAKIFSILCKKVKLGKIMFLQDINNLNGLWVDFNLSDGAISWYCNESCFKVDETGDKENSQRNLMTIYSYDVETVLVHKYLRPSNNSYLLIVFRLIRPCIDFDETYPKLIDESDNVTLHISNNEYVRHLVSTVLPQVFGKKFMNKWSTSRLSSNKRPSYKPLDVAFSKYFKPTTENEATSKNKLPSKNMSNSSGMGSRSSASNSEPTLTRKFSLVSSKRYSASSRQSEHITILNTTPSKCDLSDELNPAETSFALENLGVHNTSRERIEYPWRSTINTSDTELISIYSSSSRQSLVFNENNHQHQIQSRKSSRSVPAYSRGLTTPQKVTERKLNKLSKINSSMTKSRSGMKVGQFSNEKRTRSNKTTEILTEKSVNIVDEISPSTNKQQQELVNNESIEKSSQFSKTTALLSEHTEDFNSLEVNIFDDFKGCSKKTLCEQQFDDLRGEKAHFFTESLKRIPGKDNNLVSKKEKQYLTSEEFKENMEKNQTGKAAMSELNMKIPKAYVLSDSEGAIEKTTVTSFSKNIVPVNKSPSVRSPDIFGDKDNFVTSPKDNGEPKAIVVSSHPTIFEKRLVILLEKKRGMTESSSSDEEESQVHIVQAQVHHELSNSLEWQAEKTSDKLFGDTGSKIEHKIGHEIEKKIQDPTKKKDELDIIVAVEDEHQSYNDIKETNKNISDLLMHDLGSEGTKAKHNLNEKHTVNDPNQTLSSTLNRRQMRKLYTIGDSSHLEILNDTTSNTVLQPGIETVNNGKTDEIYETNENHVKQTKITADPEERIYNELENSIKTKANEATATNQKKKKGKVKTLQENQKKATTISNYNTSNKTHVKENKKAAPKRKRNLKDKCEISYDELKRERAKSEKKLKLLNQNTSLISTSRKESHLNNTFQDMLDSFREEMGGQTLLEKLGSNKEKQSITKKTLKKYIKPVTKPSKPMNRNKKLVFDKQMRDEKDDLSNSSMSSINLNRQMTTKVLSNTPRTPSPKHYGRDGYKENKIKILSDIRILPGRLDFKDEIPKKEAKTDEHLVNEGQLTASDLILNVSGNQLGGVEPLKITLPQNVDMSHKQVVSEEMQHSKNISNGCLARVSFPAPPWESTAIIDEKLVQVKSVDYLGKYLVLFFFPFDCTFSDPLCPSEILSFNTNLEGFKKIGAQVVACSFDSPYSHLAWIRTPVENGGLGKLEVPLLSDWNLEICKAYGVYQRELSRLCKALFIIDPNGIILGSEIILGLYKFNVDKILQFVQDLYSTYENVPDEESHWNK